MVMMDCNHTLLVIQESVQGELLLRYSTKVMVAIDAFFTKKMLKKKMADMF